MGDNDGIRFLWGVGFPLPGIFFPAQFVPTQQASKPASKQANHASKPEQAKPGRQQTSN